MAQVSYRGNLTAAQFPFISKFQGQTIIVKQYDNSYVSAVESGKSGDTGQDVGIPQIYYCHNVMPTDQGVCSIGYQQVADKVTAEEANFRSIFLIRSDDGSRAYFSHTADGRNFVKLGTSTVWNEINGITGTAGKQVTSAYVQGVTYIFYESIGCYKYNFNTNMIEAVTLAGIDPATSIGITSASGYLIVYSKDAIAWSSTVDPTDFVPSLSTGAGGGNVEGAKGIIVACLPSVSGFIVYTSANAVASVYSGNARFPFNNKEIVGSGGLANQELAAADGNAGAQYAYTAYGLQLITFQQASVIFPSLTDFIAGAYFEDYDETNNEFVITKLTSTMKKKLTIIAGRYLVLSYGISSLTHAIIYDIAQKRFGKCKVNHEDCFEYTVPTPEVIESPKKAIGFLKKDGTIVVVDFSIGAENSRGVVLLGKYQYIRQRNIQLDTVVLENTEGESDVSVFALPTLNGKDFTGIYSGQLINYTEGDQAKEYGFDVAGKNHSLLVIGSFYLCSIVLNFHIHGRL